MPIGKPAAEGPPQSKRELLDFREPRNWPLYLLGIAAESAATIALMGVGLLVATLGFILRR